MQKGVFFQIKCETGGGVKPKLYGRADMELYKESIMNNKNADKGPLLNSEWKRFCEDEKDLDDDRPNP